MTVNHSSFKKNDVTPVALFVAAPDLLREFQIRRQQMMQEENRNNAKPAITAEDLAQQHQPPPVFNPHQMMQQQQQRGIQLSLSDDERTAIRERQMAAQKAAIRPSL